MPNRADLRHFGKMSKRIWVVGVGVIILLAFVGGVIWQTHGKDSANSNAVSSSSIAKKVQKSSKSSKASKTSEALATSKLKDTSDSLVGLGFIIAPVKYNGEDVDTAMDANRAPQNTVHDGTMEGYVKSASVVQIGMLGGYSSVSEQHYSTKDGYFKLNNMPNIKYAVKNGKLLTSYFTEKQDEATITYELRQSDSVKSDFEWRLTNQKDSESSSTGVDQKNLTTAQLEYWTAQVTQSMSEVSANDCTFKHSFVNGYAVVDVYAKDDVTKKTDHMATYRVNQDGYLEIKDNSTDSGWRVVSQQYY